MSVLSVELPELTLWFWRQTFLNSFGTELLIDIKCSFSFEVAHLREGLNIIKFL
jgi:hypothetical protein